MICKLHLGARVRLKSFHETLSALANINEAENYWLLIGETGTVVSDEKRVHPAYIEMGERLLVQFHLSIDSYGLYCHNDLPNSLWIFGLPV